MQSLIKSSQCKQCWAVHTGRVHNWRGKRTVPVLAIGRIQHYHIPYHIIYLTSFPPSCSLVNIYQSYHILLIFAIVHCLASLALQIHCDSIYGLLPGPIQPTFYSLPKIVSVKIMVTEIQGWTTFTQAVQISRTEIIYLSMYLNNHGEQRHEYTSISILSLEGRNTIFENNFFESGLILTRSRPFRIKKKYWSGSN